MAHATSILPALRTDRYEFTMLDAALRDGTAERLCVFETFARALPTGRRYGVVAGLDRVIDAIEHFTFDEETLAWLSEHKIVSDTTVAWLKDFRFSGEVHAYREGDLYFPNSPVLTVTAPFGVGVLLETIVLSILNFDSAVASAAARMVDAAAGRHLLEFGSRRTHEEAAIAAARAAYIVGFDATSNLAAGARYGIPTAGTSAHAFMLVHDTELGAFAGQLRAAGPNTTLLVDTFATEQGIRNAIDAARSIHGPDQLGAIRIDSGDLGALAHQARKLLDDAGFTSTRIIVSGDLDEYRIAAFGDAPIDGFGVGTSVVTGSGAPTAGFIYKLVARQHRGQWIPVAKSGGIKATRGGRKRAYRLLADGTATSERLGAWDAPAPSHARELQIPVIVDGAVVERQSLAEVRAHHAHARAEFAPTTFTLTDGPAALHATPSDTVGS